MEDLLPVLGERALWLLRHPKRFNSVDGRTMSDVIVLGVATGREIWPMPALGAKADALETNARRTAEVENFIVYVAMAMGGERSGESFKL
jgi:hypothetical protein